MKHAAHAAIAPAAPKAKKPRRRLLWRIIFWLALIVFIGSAGVLGFYLYSYWSADRGYQDIAAQGLTSVSAQDMPADADATELADMTVDWDYLRSLNPDIVAWVVIPDTRVNYPVVQGHDNEEYLHKDFSQKEDFGARGGAIFLEASNSPDFSDENNVLYGHHMRDGSMFACLSKDFVNGDFFDAHRTFYVLTPEKNYKLQAFSLVLTNGWDEIVQTRFGTDDQRSAYIKDKEQRSVVAPAGGMPDPASITQLFTLSTCDYQETNGRAVLFSSVVDTVTPSNA